MWRSPKPGSEKKAIQVRNKLMKEFNSVALINGYGTARDAEGFYVNVYLEREPTTQEAAILPKERDGVRIKYQLLGPLNPEI